MNLLGYYVLVRIKYVFSIDNNNKIADAKHPAYIKSARNIDQWSLDTSSI